MTQGDKPIITVQTTVQANIEQVWRCFTEPEHIVQWNAASEDWHTPAASNDLREGGTFTYTMAARDGSVSFDFGGTYDEVEQHQKIAYTMGDGRRAELFFVQEGASTTLTETFEAEGENSLELQEGGWQAILNNFKKHVESL